MRTSTPTQHVSTTREDDGVDEAEIEGKARERTLVGLGVILSS
jgi:hypothetical protein